MRLILTLVIIGNPVNILAHPIGPKATNTLLSQLSDHAIIFSICAKKGPVLQLSKFLSLLIFTLVTLEIHLYAKPFENQANVGLQVDYGRLFVNSHDIQFGGNGTRIDLVEDAGQNRLFEFYRFTAVVKKEIHTLALIYQPIFLDSVDVVRSTLVVDERNISEGTPIDMSYNFPYTRLSYWYLLPYSGFELRVGGALQIRNASIALTTTDGQKRVIRGDIGALPLILFKLRYRIAGIETETEFNFLGLNQKRRDRGGFFHEFALQAKRPQGEDLKLSLGFRILKGGYAGESSSSKSAPRRYTSNWIHATGFFLGAAYEL